MDVTLKYNLVFLSFIVFIVISEWVTAADPTKGHYRCTWHTGPSSSASDTTQTTYAGYGDQVSCSVDDSARLTSYINYCTKQNYVPLLACKDSGQWNCDSFLAMCKTIIHSNPMTGYMSSRTTMVPRKIQTDQKPKAIHPAESSAKEFNANENYFTMKEMAVAVLVSFITGATVLALVIFVVWRWRNCHVSAEHRREETRGSMKNMEPLQVLGHLAHAVGIGQDKHSNKSFVNPNYGQLVTTRDILEEVINEQDRAYEEILMRRKSSCNHADCIYATVDKTRAHPTIVRTKSGNELRTIDENVESDVGYDGDINATPQTPRRFVKYLSRSPAVSETRFSFGPVDAELLRHSLNHLRPPKADKPKDGTRDNQDPPKIFITGDSLPVQNDVIDCNKSDSGYVEEMTELNANEIRSSDQSHKSKGAQNDDTGRKSSLRL